MDTHANILTAHEVTDVFEQHQMPLSKKISEMLQEHFSHQTERRGCGFTQATRVLAEYVNTPRLHDDFNDGKLFLDFPQRQLQSLLQQAPHYELELNSWRNLDIQPQVKQFLATAREDDFKTTLQQQVKWQDTLRHIHKQLQQEESILLVSILQDIILPPTPEANATHLPTVAERPKVGSCPMAEKFFLEVAHERTTRRGQVNVFTNAQNQAVVLEKIGMGDDHSCINVQPLYFNGVRLPIGSSFAVQYDAQAIDKTATQFLNGAVMPLEQCDGFWFLRLTTLSVSPENRQRAFTTHFKQQIDNGLFSPETTTMQQLIDIAQKQLASI